MAYLDADLATPLSELMRISKYLNDDIEFVFGSRVNRIGSNIERKLHRHLIGRMIATIISSGILKIPIYDSQCGAKVMTKSVAEAVFSNKFKTNWVFDVELIQRLLKFKKSSDINQYAKEIPLEVWTDIGDSKIKPKHYLQIIKNLLQLYYSK